MIVAAVCLLTGMLFGAGDDAQMRILELARSGRNAEAIRVYEALPDKTQADIAVLRAAAGCYWRERQFEEARTLYRAIMERQSTLTTLESGGPEDALPQPTAVEPLTAPAGSEAVAPDAAVQANETAGTEALEPPSGNTSAEASTVVQAQATLESRAAALQQRIAALEQDVESARKAQATLKAEADQKMNDLLDAIETEKARRVQTEAELRVTAATLEAQKASAAETAADLERQVEAAREQVVQEQSLAAAAAADHQMREVALRARVAQVMAAGESAKLQVALLEQALDQLRGQLDVVSAKLAVRNLDVDQVITRMDHESLERALDEIERLEQEQATRAAAAQQQQSLLHERIETLETQASMADGTLATRSRELEDERRRRFDLEAQTQAQAQALEERAALLEEAKAALARQYDALREHVQGGATIRLEGGVQIDAAEARMSRSPDLVPMIGQLEAATTTAVAEVDRLKKAVAARDRTIGMLEDDLQRERDGTARVLSMARETEAALTARIRELENTRSTPGSETASPVLPDAAAARE